MDLERDGNLIEAGVWIVLSLVLLVHTFRSEEQLRRIPFFLQKSKPQIDTDERR